MNVPPAKPSVTPPAIRWEPGELHLLDQRLLPHQVHYLRIDGIPAAVDAIANLAVRGAPAIGIAAAYALAVAACHAIGEHGRVLIGSGDNVLTHCNAGGLAVSELGTATAPMYLSHWAGVSFHVFVDETRPLFQGARLTAWELRAAGIDLTLICDNAAASLMASGQVDLIIVGTDRITRNGDVVNKIGTLNLAVLARYFGVPFYVACPSSTFDADTPSGRDVTIEERDGNEVRQDHAAQVRAFNPAFDVTPAGLVSGVITEHGVARPPLAESLPALIGQGSA